MLSISRFLWSAMGSGKAKNSAEDSTSAHEPEDQGDFNDSASVETGDASEKHEKVGLFAISLAHFLLKLVT
jgi:hypothetical protein